MIASQVRLTIAVQRAIERCARTAWPREIVAALGGRRRGGTVVVEHMVPFAGAGTHDAFAVTPVAFVAAEAELAAAGTPWLGFVHSHPGGTAAPSTRDRHELWRGCVQMIVAGATPDRLTHAAFWLTDDACTALPVSRSASEAWA